MSNSRKSINTKKRGAQNDDPAHTGDPFDESSNKSISHEVKTHSGDGQDHSNLPQDENEGALDLENQNDPPKDENSNDGEFDDEENSFDDEADEEANDNSQLLGDDTRKQDDLEDNESLNNKTAKSSLYDDLEGIIPNWLSSNKYVGIAIEKDLQYECPKPSEDRAIVLTNYDHLDLNSEPDPTDSLFLDTCLLLKRIEVYIEEMESILDTRKFTPNALKGIERKYNEILDWYSDLDKSSYLSMNICQIWYMHARTFELYGKMLKAPIKSTPSTDGRDRSASPSTRNQSNIQSQAASTNQKQLKLSDNLTWLLKSGDEIVAGNSIKFMSPKNAETLSTAHITDLNNNIFPAINKNKNRIQEEDIKSIAVDIIRQCAVGNSIVTTKLMRKLLGALNPFSTDAISVDKLGGKQFDRAFQPMESTGASFDITRMPTDFESIISDGFPTNAEYTSKYASGMDEFKLKLNSLIGQVGVYNNGNDETIVTVNSELYVQFHQRKVVQTLAFQAIKEAITEVVTRGKNIGLSEVAFEKLKKLHNSLNDSANEEKGYLVTFVLPLGEPFKPLSLAGHSMIQGLSAANNLLQELWFCLQDSKRGRDLYGQLASFMAEAYRITSDVKLSMEDMHQALTDLTHQVKGVPAQKNIPLQYLGITMIDEDGRKIPSQVSRKAIATLVISALANRAQHINRLEPLLTSEKVIALMIDDSKFLDRYESFRQHIDEHTIPTKLDEIPDDMKPRSFDQFGAAMIGVTPLQPKSGGKGSKKRSNKRKNQFNDSAPMDTIPPNSNRKPRGEGATLNSSTSLEPSHQVHMTCNSVIKQKLLADENVVSKDTIVALGKLVNEASEAVIFNTVHENSWKPTIPLTPSGGSWANPGKLPLKAFIFFQYLRGIAHWQENDVTKFPDEFTNIEVDSSLFAPWQSNTPKATKMDIDTVNPKPQPQQGKGGKGSGRGSGKGNKSSEQKSGKGKGQSQTTSNAVSAGRGGKGKKGGKPSYTPNKD